MLRLLWYKPPTTTTLVVRQHLITDIKCECVCACVCAWVMCSHMRASVSQSVFKIWPLQPTSKKTKNNKQPFCQNKKKMFFNLQSSKLLLSLFSRNLSTQQFPLMVSGTFNTRQVYLDRSELYRSILFACIENVLTSFASGACEPLDGWGSYRWGHPGKWYRVTHALKAKLNPNFKAGRVLLAVKTVS